MTDSNSKTLQSAYIAFQSLENMITPYRVNLSGRKELYKSVKPGEWILVVNKELQAASVGRIYSLRITLKGTTVFFDKYFDTTKAQLLTHAELSPPKTGQITRLEWTGFVEALPKLFNKTIADIPLIEDAVYVRDLLQYAVMDDLLGPANGPFEQILDMSVRDRYLLGRLAPMDSTDKSGGFGVDGSGDDEEEPEDLVVKAQANKPDSTGGDALPESESNEEVDTGSNQSLIPSSFGMTFCVAGDIDKIVIEALWARYERFYDHEMHKTIKDRLTGEEKQGQKVKIWQRIPRGETITLALTTGVIKPISLDKEQPEVVIQ